MTQALPRDRASGDPEMFHNQSVLKCLRRCPWGTLSGCSSCPHGGFVCGKNNPVNKVEPLETLFSFPSQNVDAPPPPVVAYTAHCFGVTSDTAGAWQGLPLTSKTARTEYQKMGLLK